MDLLKNKVVNASLKFGFQPEWTDQVFGLYNKTELQRNDRDKLHNSFANSQVVVSIWIEDKPIAIGRAISDFKMYSSIFDVVVDPQYQRMGFGKMIMTSLLEKLGGTAVYLTSTFGNEEFYRGLGFKFHKTALALYPERIKESSYLHRSYEIPEKLKSHGEISFDLARFADVEGCYPLNEQLGYQTDYSSFKKRYCYLMNAPEHSLIVAKKKNNIVGWMHLAARRLLEDEDFAQLAGIIVDKNKRGLGIGKSLVKIAEDWARYHGFSRIRLQSSVTREDAHKFYLNNGYTHVKISKVFMKELE